MMNFTVGQTLFFVPCSYSSRHRRATNAYTVVIERIGRKYLTTSHGLRLDKGTLIADGGEYASPGRAWRTEGDYLTWLTQRQAWEAFQDKVRRWIPPVTVTIEHIAEAGRLIGISEQKEPHD